MNASISKRFARFSAALLGLAVLAGCLAPEVKVNPTRTGLLATWAVAPKGADGVTTTKTEECTFRAQISVAKAEEYEKNPGLVVEENNCVEFDDKRKLAQLAVHGSPQLLGEMVKIGTGAVTTGSVNYLVQSAIQRKQGRICAAGGCITTANTNINIAQGGEGGHGGNAQGGSAAALSQSSAGASASVESSGSGSGCGTGSCQ